MNIKKTHKETKEVEVVDENYDICDKCGKTMVDKPYDGFSCTFERNTGSRYPSATDLEVEKLELCEACSENLVKYLGENGYNFQKYDLNY